MESSHQESHRGEEGGMKVPAWKITRWSLQHIHNAIHKDEELMKHFEPIKERLLEGRPLFIEGEEGYEK